MSNLIPNNEPVVVVFQKPGDDPGDYHQTYYRVVAWREDGMALVLVPGMARLLPADIAAIHLGSECLGAQHEPVMQIVPPPVHGPFHPDTANLWPLPS